LLPDVPYHAVIDSSEVGMVKPDEAIFRLATEKADVAPAEILLIDDTHANLRAAEHAGWHALLFDDYRSDESVARARKALEPQEAPAS
jgi:FMN phosphatase YigB (HAD superfamily)